MASSIYELYGDLWGTSVPGFAEDLEQSLVPRDADPMIDWLAHSDLGPDQIVLDAGSRDAHHAIELAQRFGCRCVAIDPVPLHRKAMGANIAAAGMGDRVSAVAGVLEALPFGDATADAIWCRDVLNHVDLPRGFAECARVLRPGGVMIIYVTLATGLCEPREAARLYDALAIIPANMERGYFEERAREAGFEIADRYRLDSERRERDIENGDTGVLQALLRLARMRRREDELVQRYGRNRYEAAYAGDLWGIYQLLGKLCPMLYLLRKP